MQQQVLERNTGDRKKYYSSPYLIRATQDFSIGDRTYSNLSVLIDEYNCVIEPVTDYLRYMAVYENNSELSNNEYAKILRQYWEFISIQEVEWDEANDNLMRAWRDWMLSRKESPLKKRTINGILTIVYNFYWWCELNGYTFNVIGQSGQHHFDCEKCGHSNRNNITYRLNVKVQISTSQRGERTTSISCPLTFRTIRDIDDRNPTTDEIDKLYASISSSKNPAINSRNTLIARWCEQAMVRRCEHLALTISQIPSRQNIEQLLDEDRDEWITLEKTKGSKRRVIKVDALLLSDTRDYIDNYRNPLIDKFKSKYGSQYIEPKEIFLSHKTGQVLKENSVSNLFTESAKKAGVNNGTQHRLRSIGATELTVHTIDSEIEKHGRADIDTVLLRVQQLLGHSDDATTRKHYIRAKQSRMNRELSTHDQEFKANQRLKVAKRQLEHVRNETILSSELAQLQKEILKGNKKAILSQIEQLVEKTIKDETNHD